jgi:pimeloyl-ACP methyl ester carboxylesterase
MIAFSWIVLVVAPSGCTSILRSHAWPAPVLKAPDSAYTKQAVVVRSSSPELVGAEAEYALALQAVNCGQSDCVDHYFQAASFAWLEMQDRLRIHGSNLGRSSDIYHSSLQGLITEGQRYKRFDPRDGLRVQTRQGWIKIPCQYHGFVRSPEEFDELVPVGNYTSKDLNHIYRQEGIGVSTVVIRQRETADRFQRKKGTFNATLLLRTDVELTPTDVLPSVLEFYDPMRTSSIVVAEVDVPLSIDKSAAIARVLKTTERNYVQAFLQPGSVQPEEEGLFILEPYQRGKIPIIFIHGLLSDRFTWANVVNEIYARPWFSDRFQLWGFEYPTGMPFLKSAAQLRRQLAQLLPYLDPDATDTALHNVVLVGHSMGGLISKTQISRSGDRVWNSLSNRSFDEIAIDSRYRNSLHDAAFFEPSPSVSRVVYIGTPHRGSAIAQRAIGRLSSLLIQEPTELQSAHRKLIQDNPDVFSNEFSKRIPTSIDLLEPDSPLLSAIASLPVEPHVHTHTILGRGRWMPGSGDSDGVVPVSSARQLTAESEKHVEEKHSNLTKDPSTIQELLSILHVHYENACSMQPNLENHR